MRIELANNVNREMWFFDKKLEAIWPVHVIAESQSGNTIETIDGQRLRTSTKTHAVFNLYDFARIAQKLERGEDDEEYSELLKRNKLRRLPAQIANIQG